MLSITVITAWLKATWERKGLFHLTVVVPSGGEGRAETWRQEQKQRPWRNAAYWLVLHGSLSFLSWTTSPRGILPMG